MDEQIQKMISDIAEQVRAKIKGGTFFGYPINMDDPDMVIAAVYHVALKEEQSRSAEELDHVFSVLSIR